MRSGRCRWIVGTLSLLLVIPIPLLSLAGGQTSAAATEDKPGELVHEQWFTYTMDGEPMGWMRIVVWRTDEHYRTKELTVLRIARAGTVVESTSRSTYVERHDGTPVRVSLREVEGTEAVEYEWDFTGPQVSEKLTQFGRTRTTTRNHPQGDWLMPAEGRRHTQQQIQAGQSEIRYRAIKAELGLLPVKITMRREGETTFTVNGQETLVSQWRYQVEGLPIVATEYRCPAGHKVYQGAQVGYGYMEASLTNREAALEAVRGSPPELMAAMIVIPDRPVPDVMDTERVTLRLRVRQGDLPELPEAGGQRIVERGEGSVTTVFEPARPLPATEEEVADHAYREASPMIDINDEAVAELVEATKPEEPLCQQELAEGLHAFVYEYIVDKELDVAFATASETARTRQGDCTEHAILLAALLRGHGIAARVAEGLVYVTDYAGERHVFSWHMWTQALLDGRWVDLDATLPERRAHAGYVLTSVSSLADRDRPMEMATTLKLAGNLEIEVLEVEYDR
ncbi:MAG: transglutaminase domain-containing protein [Candidatus Bipolaricaulota bacterium]